MRPRPSTIHDVAREAGVSIGTASKALNGVGRMRAETRTRVLAAAERIDFRPNDLVRSLLRGRTYTVGLITTDYFGRFNMPVVAGIEDALGSVEILVFVCNTRDDPDRERRVIQALLAKQVDGIIVMGRRIDIRPPIDIGRSSIPVVYAFSHVEGPSVSVLPDDAQGATLAVEHLIGLGRKRIAHISGPEAREAVRLRRSAMEETLARHGLNADSELILHGEWTERWGYEATGRLVDQHADFDAVFCGSDIIARGVLDRLRESGRNVPGDVAVIGFDNWDVIAEETRPPLTTIDMNLHELGVQAAQRLLAQVEGEQLSGSVRVPCSLIVRESAPLIESESLDEGLVLQ